MSWFWGSKKKEDDDDDDDAYSGSSDEEYSTDDDDDDIDPTRRSDQDSNPNQPATASKIQIVDTNDKHNILTMPSLHTVNSSSHDDSMDSSTEEKVFAGALPQNIQIQSDPHYGNRSRTQSEVTLVDDDEEEEQEEQETNQQPSTHSSIHTTTTAAPDDTVITTTTPSNQQKTEPEQETSFAEKQSLLILAAEHDRVDILQAILKESNPQEQETLLHQGIPPLHIAIHYGSTNATQCLLRMGADPTIRPDVASIEKPAVEIANASRFDGLSAWELAFGNSNINMPPSKREAIRHAFTAEALRCIGSDEHERLQQLLDAGMPPDSDLAGKPLYDWAVEMGALQCEERLRPAQAAKHAQSNTTTVVKRPDGESMASLNNRLDELEKLAKALSSCLDNLAEEVSVCHGLLLMGGGASALASHVRSLKATKDQTANEVVRMTEALENTKDELAYWVKQAGPEGERIAEQVLSVEESNARRFEGVDEETAKRQLQAQVAASGDKVRKLRVAIADLSEENARDLAEVEKRGLSGGVSLVRNLKEEIRDLEFQLNETKYAETTFRMKITLIQSKAKSRKTEENLSQKETNAYNNRSMQTPAQETVEDGHDSISVKDESRKEKQSIESETATELVAESEKILSGQSTALTVRHEGRRGLLPLTLWRILLRIIGLSDNTPPSRDVSQANSSSQPAMVV